MQTEKVFTQIEEWIERYNLLRHPYYEAWSAGALTRADLQKYAGEYYHHVAAFPTYLSTLHSHLPDGPLRREVLRNLSDEEIRGTAHSDLWLDFAEGFGADREAIKQRTPLLAIQELIYTFRKLAELPASALAAFYAYESQVPRIAAEKSQTLQTLYHADRQTCRYFELHRVADQHHSRVWKRELETLLSEESRLAEAALHGAAEASHALWCALDGIEGEREERRKQ